MGDRRFQNIWQWLRRLFAGCFQKLSATGHYEAQADKTIVYYVKHGFRNRRTSEIIPLRVPSNGVNTPYASCTLLA